MGQSYRDFAQTTDHEFVSGLEPVPSASTPQDRSADNWPGRDEDIEILAGGVSLAGYLAVPAGAPGIVVFAHGSGSGRHSSRNRFVADVLNQAGLGTLLFDLLTLEEEADRTNVFDIELLAGRLVAVTRWLVTQSEGRSVRIGYFGASTGAAAALWASAEVDIDIAAVVSRGGRPDLAGPRLPDVTAPTLLVVGSRDDVVLNLNREAQTHLRCENSLAVVAGATHLFEESGTLREAAELARDWFLDHLAPARQGLADKGEVDPLGGDPALEAAREEAEGVELYENPHGDETALAEREAAQGVEVFTNPDEVVPVTALVEGSPGHETFVGEQAGIGSDAEGEAQERAAEESHDA
jgi:putative phosphoribosyl transferase